MLHDLAEAYQLAKREAEFRSLLHTFRSEHSSPPALMRRIADLREKAE